jgi:hypothetical protein
MSGVWQNILVGSLAVNAALAFGYRLYRLSKGGPLGDVVGQGVLAILLAAMAVAVASDVGWVRWAALSYGLLFGVVVMPVWTLAVLLPLPPKAPDYAFTIVYWLSLLVIVAAAVAL